MNVAIVGAGNIAEPYATRITAVEGLTLTGGFDNGQLAKLHPLEGSETSAAVRAHTPPPDGGAVLRRPRILDLSIFVSAKRAAHLIPTTIRQQERVGAKPR